MTALSARLLFRFWTAPQLWLNGRPQLIAAHPDHWPASTWQRCACASRDHR